MEKEVMVDSHLTTVMPKIKMQFDPILVNGQLVLNP